MKHLIVVLLAIAALITACTPRAEVSPPFPASSERTAPSRRTTSSGTLYVSDSIANKVIAFQLSGSKQLPVATITNGIDVPAGMATDGAGNLYVANAGNNTVTEYHPGGSSPVTTLSEDLSGPVDVAVDSKGTVYVANYYTFGDSIVEFPAGGSKPSLSIHQQCSCYPTALALDANENLYVTYQNFYSNPAVYEYSSGSKNGTDLELAFGSGGHFFAAGLLVDEAGNLIVAVGSIPSIEVFPPGKKSPSQSFGATGSPQLLQFVNGESDVVVSDTVNHAIEEYTYPGGSLVNTFATGLESAYGAAVAGSSTSRGKRCPCKRHT
ncbi:MAG TPA: NHL repeat-containing protein [Candidatus Cybelea sp.]